MYCFITVLLLYYICIITVIYQYMTGLYLVQTKEEKG
jgi:hypothetical protein